MTRMEGIQVVAGALLVAAGVFLAFGPAGAMIFGGAFLVLDVRLDQARRRRNERSPG